jgi:hypothetical protein|tara:strand:- start:124 stop:312 length:189 start_codon:yes stop_codon:yes gene_type:complete
MSDSVKSLKEKIEELKQQERQAYQIYFTTAGKLQAFEEALKIIYDGLSEEQVDSKIVKNTKK